MLTQLRRLGPQEQMLVIDQLVIWDLGFSFRIFVFAYPVLSSALLQMQNPDDFAYGVRVIDDAMPAADD